MYLEELALASVAIIEGIGIEGIGSSCTKSPVPAI